MQRERVGDPGSRRRAFAIALLGVGSAVAASATALLAAVVFVLFGVFCLAVPSGCWILVILVGLGGATAAIAGVAAVGIYVWPTRHRMLGAGAVGVAVADVVTILTVLPESLWGAVVLLGGWSLACTAAGGLLAFAGAPRKPPAPPYAWTAYAPTGPPVSPPAPPNRPKP